MIETRQVTRLDRSLKCWVNCADMAGASKCLPHPRPLPGSARQCSYLSCHHWKQNKAYPGIAPALGRGSICKSNPGMGKRRTSTPSSKKWPEGPLFRAGKAGVLPFFFFLITSRLPVKFCLLSNRIWKSAPLLLGGEGKIPERVLNLWIQNW